MTPRPPWTELVDGGGSTAAAAAGGPPGEGWPPLETVDYWLKLITLAILVLALPWLLGKMMSEPGRASRHAASFASGSGP
jgi:hypothetical protein